MQGRWRYLLHGMLLVEQNGHRGSVFRSNKTRFYGMSKRVSFDVSMKIAGIFQRINIDTWIHSNSNLYVSFITKEQRCIFANEFDTE